jgi:hypothetical protein
LGIEVFVDLDLGKGGPYHLHGLDSACSYIVSLREGNPSVVGTEVGSPHGLGRLEAGIHHVPDQFLTDYSNHFVQIVKILDAGDRLAGC